MVSVLGIRMKIPGRYGFQFFIVGFAIAIAVSPHPVMAQGSSGSSAASAASDGVQSAPDLAPGSAALINPEDLVKILRLPKREKPLILNVGPRLLYLQAHIPGSEFIGAGSSAEGIESLRKRVRPLPRNAFIVLYCGCCPWEHCPNVGPAYGELRSLGFSNVKVLYISDNLGADWVYKGYPTVKGQ
jgi:thiosulfate/3-mercaptopyruvate sulfurtransferase